MAKKSSSTVGNLSQAVRDILAANPKFSADQVLEALTAAHPGLSINKPSFNVTYYNAKKKLGISSTRKRVGRKPGVKKLVKKRTAAVASTGSAVSSRGADFAALRAAAQFVREVGGAKAALNAIETLQALQMQ